MDKLTLDKIRDNPKILIILIQCASRPSDAKRLSALSKYNYCSTIRILKELVNLKLISKSEEIPGQVIYYYTTKEGNYFLSNCKKYNEYWVILTPKRY